MTLPLSREDLIVEDRKRWINATIQSIKESRCFDMCNWSDCIGGHACRAGGTRVRCEDNVLEVVSRLFHISYEGAATLCLASKAVMATKKDAIRTLERLRDTGKVHWD